MSSPWLPRALEESRARGFLGPQPIAPQILHAEGFVSAFETQRSTPPSYFLDLGSGGGLPGLVLLDHWHCRAVFLDSMTKRARFLEEVLEWDDVHEDARMVTARAEEAARWPEFDGAFDLVVARSFGPPAVTAECAVRFLSHRGLLIVSEPPDSVDSSRWPKDGLGRLGLEFRGYFRFGAGFAVLEKVAETERDFPRSSGTPKKRPLF